MSTGDAPPQRGGLFQRQRSPATRFRFDIWPRNITDCGSTAFLTLAYPAIFYFELTTVLPAVIDPANPVAFYTHALIATFILTNIIGNQLGLILVSPSIRQRHLEPPTSAADRRAWRFCPVCETLVPPRAWHCATCAVCILKRDHHCAFSSCCVGHHNQRYFWWLTVWLFIGTTYATLFNSAFIFWVHEARFWHPLTAVKIAFPFAMILVEPSWDQAWLTAYLVCALGSGFCGFLCLYHGQNMWRGQLVNERGAVGEAEAKRGAYDVGGWRNVRMVLGDRWWLTWLSPLVRSELPEDGVQWAHVVEEAARLAKTC